MTTDTRGTAALRAGIPGRLYVALAIFAIVAPFLWILTASFKHQIAIYAGQFPFTPTLANYADVLFGRRSDFSGNIANSLIVAASSTALVLVVGALAA